MTVWNHTRKGRIEGEDVTVEPRGEWMHIKLTGDQTLRAARGQQQWLDGDIVTVRASFLTEVAP